MKYTVEFNEQMQAALNLLAADNGLPAQEALQFYLEASMKGVLWSYANDSDQIDDLVQTLLQNPGMQAITGWAEDRRSELGGASDDSEDSSELDQ